MERVLAVMLMNINVCVGNSPQPMRPQQRHHLARARVDVVYLDFCSRIRAKTVSPTFMHTRSAIAATWDSQWVEEV